MNKYQMLPRCVKIGKREIHVYYVKEIEKYDAPMQDGSTIMGLWDPNENIVFLRKDLKKFEMVQTYIHELLHAVSDEYNLNLTHPSIYKYQEIITYLLPVLQGIKLKGDKKCPSTNTSAKNVKKSPKKQRTTNSETIVLNALNALAKLKEDTE